MKKLLALAVVFCGPIGLSLGTTGCTAKETEKGKDSAEERKSDHDLIQGTWKTDSRGGIRLVFTGETVSMGGEGEQPSTARAFSEERSGSCTKVVMAPPFHLITRHALTPCWQRRILLRARQ
jgi:hypothetical protein